jgi:hypothetical protein
MSGISKIVERAEAPELALETTAEACRLGWGDADGLIPRS